ncbi:hypothetical protein FPSE_08102 [Fusarium pseudograminearum CS3096]|uniref:Heterokaryon incompatibility domain-containing protein n=1 Tax=Fusarium pseudograminearum (strain CS3096) TaxID=1028729 RepID=K3UIF8_FUSPC|nr:hypothetical protein FPSE_08102 [Fusarium pseudograminearum CS3096]EKJ71656.1 hypothetical protein FPSE_08102 [Fusarium pseudograminearum CS3096]
MPLRRMEINYKNAIEILNSRRRLKRPTLAIASDAQVPAPLPESGHIPDGKGKTNLRGTASIVGMRQWLHQIGHSTTDIDNLNIIHVAGTKGKGSTCAFIESFLRAHGESTNFPRKTGLYTSPHLIFPEERIRINFQPIARDLFAQYFFQVWNALTTDDNGSSSECSQTLPRYLQLIALVSFHAFIKEGVDAAIFETHHGGEYDATNVIEHPVATVITPLGMDHINQLGPNIGNIAWHKAGIFKHGSIALSSPQEPFVAGEVLRNRAFEKGVKVHFVENDPCLPEDVPQLRPDVQRMNSSVALSAVRQFLQENAPKGTAQVSCSDILRGIGQFSWPGRFQLLVQGSFKWFLDSAHNEMSVDKAAEWFIQGSNGQSAPTTRILIFSQVSKQRDTAVVLERLATALSTVDIHHVILTLYDPRQDLEAESDVVVTEADVTAQREFVKRIRLIHLQPGGIDSPSTTSSIQENLGVHRLPVACTISHVSLHQPPPYSALSYTWGDTSQKSRILIDGTSFNITKSLENALIHLRRKDLPLTLWIDALCIDQDDEVEKTEQVQQMHQIYSQASSVITWLGPASATSDAAMLWIERYGSLSSSFGIGTKPELQLRQLLETFESNPGRLPHRDLKAFLQDISLHLSLGPCGTNSDNDNDSIAVALYELFTRAYWSRVWVVQELAYGKRVQFVCGKMAVSEEFLHHALRLLRNFAHYERIKLGQNPQATNSKLASSALDLRNPVNILKIRRAAGPFPLIYLLRTLRNFQATDPRDKVFALLSFATDAPALGIKPDYQKSYEEVYLETTMSLIGGCFLDILSLCRVHNNIPELPSWVPDFTSVGQRIPLQQRAMNRKSFPIATVLQPKFSASGDIPKTAVSCELTQTSPTSLLLLAKLVDRVACVGTTWDQKAFGKWFQELKQFWDSDSVTFEAGHLKAVWRTAVADQEIRQGDQKPRLSENELDRVHNILKGLDLSAADEHTFVEMGLGNYVYQLQDIAYGRRPFRTAKGHIGIGPSEMATGDLLYILIGADVPYILRPDIIGKVRLIGESYVHGIMDGEAMEEDPPIDAIDMC